MGDQIQRFYIELPEECRGDRTTELAISLVIDGRTIWIPRSQILEMDVDHETKLMKLCLPEWLVNKHGLEIYVDERWDFHGRPD